MLLLLGGAPVPGAMAQSLDLGDAPDPGYPTLVTSDGASHVLGSRTYLGFCVDAEADGQPSSAADGDDLAIGNPMYRSPIVGTCVDDDDEDGVVFTSLIAVGAPASIEVFAANDCTLSAWVDFNADGDWADAGEELFTGGVKIAVGLNELSFDVPADAVEGTSWARFRCTSDGPVSYTGQASDGEVEDYQVEIGLPRDYGDTPDPSYPTLKANDGARHVLGSEVFLGSCIDADEDGHVSAMADGDDRSGGNPAIGGCGNGDDEDGVHFISLLTPGSNADVEVEASAACTLSAWIDFNQDGDWADAGEELFPGGIALVAGVNSLSFPVPGDALAGLGFSRFRCTTDGAVAPTGEASDGEVEDYTVIIETVEDYGDAPDPSYPTLAASSGASHILGGGVFLGSCVDADPDGQVGGGGDDRAAGNPVFGECGEDDDDEDGVHFTDALVAGEAANVEVEASADCTLSAWIDFNDDGDWDDPDDELFPGGMALVAGVNSLGFTVPMGAVPGYTLSRFRCTTDGAVSYTGQASDGEVEDHWVEISDLDYGDAADPSFPTLRANDGARHRIGGRVLLGTCVDGDLDGQPDASATGDDLAVGDPIIGLCSNSDDEDGVVFATPLFIDSTAGIEVLANDPCTLSAWLDFNADGDWDDTGEDLFPGGLDLSEGFSHLNVTVPIDAIAGSTNARFRCTTQGAVSYTGLAWDGEVEDYQVTVETPRDFGDANALAPTSLASDGARHILGSGVYLGSCVDAELDGLPTLFADGDDLLGSTKVVGSCPSGDDEDGVVFTSLLLASTTATVDVVASADCTLSAWVDFNGDGQWISPGEELFPGGTALVAGVNNLSFAVPATVTNASGFANYARFRCTTDGVVPYSGEASDGEVEDHSVLMGQISDYGDAPDPDFPTLEANAGASHLLGSAVYLGACVDGELDGQPFEGSIGDDVVLNNPVFGTCATASDEDGVVFTSAMVPGRDASIDVTASAACTLSAWIDFDDNGSWADAGDDLFPGGQALVAGINSLSFPVPVTAELGGTHARFRCTTDGVVTYTGQASDGEVEDYAVVVTAIEDWGDAPAPYPTLLADSGANHLLGDGRVFLGSCSDGDPDGRPSAAANGDDLTFGIPVRGVCLNEDDEDGVAFTSLVSPGLSADVTVVAGDACTLSAWLDFNADGDWDDAGEELFPGGVSLNDGSNFLSFDVPSGAVEGATFARFRCTTDGAVSYTGQASDGEVEDYQVTIGIPSDFGDAPDPSYPTLAASSGASHRLIGGPYLGVCVDAEADGQPSAAADGDDVANGNPVFGTCADDGGDEDGVVFRSALAAGEMTAVDVTVTGVCVLSAWIDFNADGDWDDTGEELFPGGTSLGDGVNPLSFLVPSDAQSGVTYARFRCTTDGPVSYTGEASDGEVEDYRVVISDLDFGDAPDTGYPTLELADGARHQLGGPVFLGLCIDGEADGQPSAAADGDDLAVGSPQIGDCELMNDEDGVVFTSDLIIGANATVEVTASADCTLSAWIDFDADGDWGDAEDELFPGGQSLSSGPNGLSFAVPAGAVSGTTMARFRCTTDGAVDYTGFASDGEVEDYEVTVSPAADFGDAPDPLFPTLQASGGASHLLGSGIYLGACVDSEIDGLPDAAATGDDLTAGAQVVGTCANDDDEDGVVFTSILSAGYSANLEVSATAACTLSAWVDFNGNGDWSDAEDELFPGGQALVAGVNALSFTVPAAATLGASYARFRCTSAGAVGYTGEAPDGEVEDYLVIIGEAADYGDAEDPSYPTLAASNGASHLLGSGVYLGTCVDSELDGQPAPAADGDDLMPGNPVIGSCTDGNDEDGVVFTSLLTAGATDASIDVTAAADCTLSAWIDFNADGDWEEADEDIFPGGTALVAGVNSLSYSVPVAAVSGTTAARFRCTTDGAVSYTGQASDGEVEDYQVTVGPAADFGDAPDPAYPTLLLNDGARHLLGSGVYLGACVDAEDDGLPSADSEGDDSDSGNPVFGTCSDDNDEDGVVFTSEPVAGQTADVEVTASAACTLSAWIDFTGDGDWDDPGEDLFPGGQPLVAGVNSLSFTVPDGEIASPAIARFRCTTDGAVSFTGEASDGEVEDYVLTVAPAQADLAISKTDGVTAATPGASTTYTIVVSNAGPSNATDAAVMDSFPTELSCVWTCVGAGGATCTAGPVTGDIVDIVDVPVGGTATYTAICQISPSASGTLVNTAAVEAGGYPDPDPLNNFATDDDTVLIPTSDLSIGKTDSDDPIYSTTQLTYTITVYNNGPSDAPGVVVVDTLPAALTGATTYGCAEDPAGLPTCSLGTVAAGGSVQYTVTGTIADNTSGVITNTADVSSAAGDPYLANNSVSEDTTVIDDSAPTVTNVNSYFDTGDGMIEECEMTGERIFRLLVSFSEPVYDPPGSTDLDDVTNPANYLLVSPGGNASFDTDACGTVFGDDRAQAISSVSYDDATMTATLMLGRSLGPSQWRLLVCGSTSITDAAGNPLDGDGNGTGGDDYQVTFRTDLHNRLVNPYFDCDLAGWTLTSPTPGEIEYSLADADGSADSGSVHLFQLALDNDFEISQCIAGKPDMIIGGRIRVAAGAAVFLSYTRECEHFAAPACAGTALDIDQQTLILGDTANAWLDFTSTIYPPAGTVSARCAYRISSSQGDDFDVWFDNLRLIVGVIFNDGFESGDTSRWSRTVGEVE